MSIDLCCPNCMGTVGYVDKSDGYKEKYYKLDKNGLPECPHCGSGESTGKLESFLVIGGTILLIILLTVVFLTKGI